MLVARRFRCRYLEDSIWAHRPSANFKLVKLTPPNPTPKPKPTPTPLFKDIFVASGCGVGGGSLGCANTLYRARPAFYSDPQSAGLADWEAELAPHSEEAERLLGVVGYDQDTAGDLLLKEYAL